MELSVCVTDDDYEAWRAIRIAVVPGERCVTVAELRAQDSPSLLLLLAVMDGTVVGSGTADLSYSAGGGFAAPRVLSEHRRRGVGTALLRALAEHCTGLGLPELLARVDDEGSLAFAETFGFVEVDREVEQVRAVAGEPHPPALPGGVDVVALDQRPELWADCYETFGTQVLPDFAVHTPLEISAEQWDTSWRADQGFLALHRGEVIGCAGLNPDPDRRDRAEHALTAVRRAAGGLHLDAGRQRFDAATQRAPRLRPGPDEHHRVAGASPQDLTPAARAPVSPVWPPSTRLRSPRQPRGRASSRGWS